MHLLTLVAYLLMIVSVSLANRVAKVVLVDPTNTVSGHIMFTQSCFRTFPVTVEGYIEGLTPGLHGLHVHEKGDLSGGCATTLGHYNPLQVNHGAPTASIRHVGDLGNINADANGVASFKFTDYIITLAGDFNIVDRAVVIHAGADDYGLGGQADSLTTGHAGARIACGVIELQ